MRGVNVHVSTVIDETNEDDGELAQIRPPRTSSFLVLLICNFIKIGLSLVDPLRSPLIASIHAFTLSFKGDYHTLFIS